MSESPSNSPVPVSILRKLHLIRQRKILVHAACAVIASLAVLLSAMCVAMLIDWLATLYDSRWRVVLTVGTLLAALLTTCGWFAVAWRRALGIDRVAGDVDRQVPQLEERWTTMTRLGEDAANPNVVHPAMLRRVAKEAASWEPHVEPTQVVSLSMLMRTMMCLTAITAVLAVAVVLDTRQTLVLVRRFWAPASSISATQFVDVPGDIVVGRGEPVALGAKLEGTPVEQATLFLNSAEDPQRAIKLVAHGSDHVEFSHRMRAVEEPFEYRFRAGDGQTDWHTVSVADRPEIDKLQVTVIPPDYTGRPAQTFDHLPRRISTMEKSKFELALRATMPIEHAELRFRGDTRVALVADKEGWFRWETTLDEALSLSPLLTESHGLTNRRAPTCDVSVYADKPPAVKVLAPDDQMAVRPDDTIQITFSATDDVGIGSAELLVYDTKPGADPSPVATIPIPLDDDAGAQSIQETVALDLSKFAAQDGAELSYEIRVREQRGQPANQADGQSSKLASNSKVAPVSPSKSTPGAELHADNRPSSEATTDAERASQSPASDQTAMDKGATARNNPASPSNSAAANSAGKPKDASPKNSAPTPNSDLAKNDAAANNNASATENAATAKDAPADASSKPLSATNSNERSTSPEPKSEGIAASERSADGSSQPGQNAAANPPLGNPPFAKPPAADMTRDEKARAEASAMANNPAEKPGEAINADPQASTAPRTATSQRQGLNSGDKSKGEQQAEMPPDAERPENIAANPADKTSANENTTSEKSASANSDTVKSAQAKAGSANSSKGEQSQASRGEQKSGGQQQSAASSQMASKDKQPSPSSESPPGDSMPRRSLDVTPPQSAASERMRLKVDKWAGSFSGQQRAKLELAIAPDLEALDQALAKAERTARGVVDQLKVNAKWRATHDREVTSAEKSTVDAQHLIDKLEQRSKGTPYAFVGLQVVEIGLAHVEPARNGLWQSLESDGNDRSASVSEALQHLTRARELVKDLRGQFERSRREFQLAESVEQVRKMYQVYVENSLALLQTQDSDPNRYNRKMAQFELDEEYLKRLKEVLEMREELQAELARILGDDPRLLRRFMDSLRNRSNNLREELAGLVERQNKLNREVRAWAMVDESARPQIARVLVQRHAQRASAMATAASKLQERYETWLPLNREVKDADLSAATKRIQDVATAAAELSAEAMRYIAEAQQPAVAAAPTVSDGTTGAENAAVAKPQAEAGVNASEGLNPMLADAQHLYDELAQLDVALRQVAAREDDAESATFAANRLVDTRRLIADSSAWLRQMKAHKSGNYTGAAEVDQYRLAMKTDELAGKLGAIEQSLAGMLQSADGTLPQPIADKSREFLATLDREASPNQLAAVYALHGNVFPRATDRQQAAGTALEKAEKQYDELMKLAIAELDKLPVQDPIASLLDDPTLDELLAQLEQELQLQELLGIPQRPSNLRIIGDWMRPGSSGGGGGGGSMAMGGGAMMRNQVRQDEQRARDQLNQAYRRAIARALKETKKTAKVEIAKPAKLSDWNRLVSQLGDDLRQGRDKAPPEQYRRAIEQYFSQISREVAEQEKQSP